MEVRKTKKNIEKLDISKYWERWIHSGSYNLIPFLEQIFKEIEKKVNEIIEEWNKTINKKSSQ